MTEAEIYEFAAIQLEKQWLAHSWEIPSTPNMWPGDTIKTVIHNIILNVITDTDLLLSGHVSIERWRGDA